MKKIDEKMRDRAKLVADARAILTKAETENRKMTSEESAQYDVMFSDIQAMGAEIKRFEQQAAMETELAGIEAARGGRPDPGAGSGGSGEGRAVEQAKEARAAFGKFLLSGMNSLSDGERRALQATAGPSGGYVVPPMQWVNELIQAKDNLVWMRQLATKYPVMSAASLGVPSLDADPADADWTSEIATGSEDSTMAFGKRELHPHPCAKLLKVSNKLLMASPMNVDALVRDRLAYKFAVTEEAAFMTGNGVNKPLGVFTASADGIPTSRDYATGNDTDSPKFDGLIGAKYTLKAAYRNSPSVRWVFHKDTIAKIVKLKDGQGQYIWQPSVVAGQPDRLLNMPLAESEYAPNTFTTGLYVGVLGDFSRYWIADAMNMTVQRLLELYAATNQTGYIGRQETDGAPVLAEAFVRVKLG